MLLYTEKKKKKKKKNKKHEKSRRQLTPPSLYWFVYYLAVTKGTVTMDYFIILYTTIGTTNMPSVLSRLCKWLSFHFQFKTYSEAADMNTFFNHWSFQKFQKSTWSTIKWYCESASVSKSSAVQWISESSAVQWISESSAVQWISESSAVQWISESSAVQWIS